MGHLQVRFILMGAFFFSSQHLITHSSHFAKKSEIEISRFSGTFLLNHPEKETMQVTDPLMYPLTRSARIGTVSKLISPSFSTSPAPNRKRRSPFKRKSGRTTQEFEMREKSGSTQIEKEALTFSETGNTLGTTDQQQDPCLPHVPSTPTGQNNDNHNDTKSTELTISNDTSKSSPLCQKVLFVCLSQDSNFTLYGYEEEKEVVRESVSVQVEKRLKEIPLVDAQDHLSTPIFFVYPQPFLWKMDHHREPNFYSEEEYLAFISSSNRNAKFFLYDTRVLGGFDSYGLDVSIPWNDSSSWNHVVNNLESGMNSLSGKSRGGRRIGNASSNSYNELCKSLLEHG